MMDVAKVRWPNSLWAAVTPPGPDLPELSELLRPMSSSSARASPVCRRVALTRSRRRCDNRRSRRAGLGASGRNNGQVIPTLSRPDPDDIVAKHGAVGERFVALLRDSASTLFDLARRYQILAEQEQAGGFSRYIRRTDQDRRTAGAQWSKFGACGRIAVARPDPPDAGIGCLVRRLLEPEAAATINPLALSRGLARVVIERGARIYARSPAISFKRTTAAGWSPTEKG